MATHHIIKVTYEYLLSQKDLPSSKLAEDLGLDLDEVESDYRGTLEYWVQGDPTFLEENFTPDSVTVEVQEVE